MANWTWVTWMSAGLAFLMTSLLVTSRTALMWLLRLYKYEQIHPATWYASVLILLVTPHLVHLVKLVWDTPIISPANRERFPSAPKIVIGILGSTLEGMATAVFATEVTPVLPESVLMTLPYSILAFYFITTVCRQMLKSQTENGYPKTTQTPCLMKNFWYLVASLYTLCAPVAVGVLLNLWSSFRFNIPECTALIVTLITMAGVWSPDVQKATITSKSTKRRCQLVEFVYMPFRIISIFMTIFMCLLFKVKFFRLNMDVFLTPMLEEFGDYRIWLPIALCVTSGFLSLTCSVTASKMGLVAAGVKVPLLLSPVITMFIVVATWNDFQTEAFWELWGTDSLSWTAFGLSAITWLIPFCFPILGILKSPCIPGRDVMDSFFAFSWHTFFMEPKLILNYERCSIGKQSLYCCLHSGSHCATIMNDSRKKRPNVVFICTTMYKESDKEMRRYMNSVKDVMSNKVNIGVEVEAHIFFDGSVEDGGVNSRGRHLVSLLCETFGIKFDHLEKNKTPYGCQIHTGSLLPYPVFIHFKDTSKVKAKKRWSQVMYLHYLLQFRCRHSFGKPPMIGDKRQGLKVVDENSNKRGWNVSLKLNKNQISDKADGVSLRNETNPGKRYSIKTTTVGCQSLNAQQLCHSLYKRPTHRSNNCKHHGTTSGNDVNGGDSPSLQHCDRLILSPCKYLNSRHHENPGHRGGQTPCQEICTQVCCQTSGTEKVLQTPGTPVPYPGSRSHKEMSLSQPCTQLSWPSPEDVFLLATDADTEFTSRSVADILSQCQGDSTLGAVCGRTVPVGSAKPIVWYQKFEYAKDFWLVKASQNVIGSVTCCPGCFSLYRASAIAQVCQEFSQPTTSAFDSMVKDHGEDRWLCTLLMQRGWRLAYSTHAYNSTHCPETVGEFLRQRRRWVLSELSNMAAIFMTMPGLVRHNRSFSTTFIVSLFMTFMWVISSPATTLVFLCAGGDVLFNVSLYVTLPLAFLLFIFNAVVCCTMSQSRQKLAVMVGTVVMATAVLALSVGFVLYVVRTMENDLIQWGSVQFRPYFLVFLLVLAIVYAALLHPRESLSLVYGFSYALLFPAMFVVLPIYALANMVDQSWGTREAGTRGCCQQPQEEEDTEAYKEFAINISELISLKDRKDSLEENTFWRTLKENLVGVKVNVGSPGHALSQDLRKLRCTCVSIFVFINLLWFVSLGLIHACAGSDVICYLVASVFSFSLLLQLIGLTSYKCNSLIRKYLSKRNALALNLNPGNP